MISRALLDDGSSRREAEYSHQVSSTVRWRTWGLCGRTSSRRAILIATHRFEPLHDSSFCGFGDGHVSHRAGGCSAMPVFDVRCRPDHIARLDGSHRLALDLHPPCSCRDDEQLPKRVTVPMRASAWLKSHGRSGEARLAGGPERRSDGDRTGEVALRRHPLLYSRGRDDQAICRPAARRRRDGCGVCLGSRP